MDVAFNRHSRRSTTNLNHLSLAPLTPRFPIGDEEELPEFDATRRTISYIEGKSAPTTPGILSRNPSFTRIRRKQQDGLSKSKSSSQLLRTKKAKRSSALPTADSSEWLQRAGAVISSETRESKGQGWLASRASSTSLVDTPERSESFSFADDEFSPLSTRDGRFFTTSRAASAMTSRVASRRGSRAGSRAELLSTPRRSGAVSAGAEGDSEAASMFGDGEFVAEPDFVDADEELYADENADEDVDLSRLARRRGFGLGGWVDRLIAWSLISEEDVEEEEHEEEDDEDDEEEEEEEDDDDEEDDEEGDVTEVGPDRDDMGGQARKMRPESDRIVAAPPQPPPRDDADGEGGWQDAAYLLSLATKILL